WECGSDAHRRRNSVRNVTVTEGGLPSLLRFRDTQPTIWPAAVPLDGTSVSLALERRQNAFRRAMTDADRRLSFEGSALDLANEQLLHDGEVVSLTQKAFAVPRRLVEDTPFAF